METTSNALRNLKTDENAPSDKKATKQMETVKNAETDQNASTRLVTERNCVLFAMQYKMGVRIPCLHLFVPYGHRG